MKKLLLFASIAALSINLATAQAPGVNAAATYAYDDFQKVGGYNGTITGVNGTSDGGGIYYYSANSANQNGQRAVGSSTFTYTTTTGGTNVLAVNFGNYNTNTNQPTFKLNLSTMADIEVDLQNTGPDLLIRFFLQDSLGNKLEIEPNLSDCVGVPNFSTPNPNATWTGYNMVYPIPSDTSAVYPLESFNGFVIPAGQRDTYRIDLSSVPTSIGGRAIDYSNWWSGKPYGSPGSKPAPGNFDITKVTVLNFVFNEKGLNNDNSNAYHYSGKGLDTTSYKYDINTFGPQSTWTGSLILHSLKVGSILSPLGAARGSVLTDIVDDAIVDNSLLAYPNPAKESLNVSFESGSAATVSLIDIVGNTAYTTVAIAGQNQINVNTSNLTKGMYILNVTTDHGRASRKISIQ